MSPLPLAALWLLGPGACDGGAPALPAPPPETVLLVSMDTARADAFSCYQEENHWALGFPPEARPAPATPFVDSMAASGVRFAWALAPSPTTLSSHTALFSGLDSHGHGVVRNGYPVDAALPLLTERFQAAGWDTLAVIGASPLERAMGLDRGFAVYDDLPPAPTDATYIRNASEVTQRALDAVDGREQRGTADDPLFLFVHYYDAHMPWFTAPPELVQRFVDPDYDGPVDGSMASIAWLTQQRLAGTLRFGDARQARALYLAQVAWVDHQLHLLWQGLEQRGLTHDALLVLFADHGETLEENPINPYSRGPDVDLVDIHVPLIFSGRGSLALPAGAAVERPVRLQDVASTLCARLHLGGGLGIGQDLSALWRGDELPPVAHYAEATKPIKGESKTAWNNLPFERAVARDGAILITNPSRGGVASLHRVAPGQPALPDAPRARELASLLRAWDAQAPPHRQARMSQATRQALEALGYLSAGPDPGAAEP